MHRRCGDACHKGETGASARLLDDHDQGFRTRLGGRNVKPVSDHPKKAEQQRRERRLSAALRENLKRRKAQAKARTAANPAVSGAEHDDQPHDSAGIAADKRRVE